VVLEAVAGAVAVLLVLVGVAIMVGPALPRSLRRLRSRRERPLPPPLTGSDEINPTTRRALACAERLAKLLLDQGLRRQAAAVREAGMRLRADEAKGIYAMRDTLRRLRSLRLDDPQDQEIVKGLIAQAAHALDDRAEQLELLPRG
jgi:hypothetical protein